MIDHPGDFLLEMASWQSDQGALELVRRQVFIEEQGFTDEEEWDDKEQGSQHVLATSMTGEPIGTAEYQQAAIDRWWRVDRSTGYEFPEFVAGLAV